MALALRTLIEACVQAGLIDLDTAGLVRQDVQKKKIAPMEAISCRGRIPESSIYQAVAQWKGIPYFSRDRLHPLPEVLKKIPRGLIQRKQILPVAREGDEIFLASPFMEETEYHQVREALRMVLDQPFRFVLASPEDLKYAVEQALRLIKHDDFTGIQAVEDTVKFVDKMMREAFIWRASDIHVEPEEKHYRIRFRVDGILQVYQAGLSREAANTVLSRIKILGGLDIAETREFQDGSFTYALEGMDAGFLDIRVATAPTRYGERATLRLLGVDAKMLTLEMLGFPLAIYRQFEQMIKRPHGLILITGPTGSGKTTTLYAALRVINHPGKNILTVENPVEYHIQGVSQIQVDTAGKVTFASSLRSLLRHDPDVLMVGEIRDLETAQIALRAAITGHMVFSTLHTNMACGSITRLLDMGCEPYLLASTLTTSIAQRLVRRLCPACKRPVRISEEDRIFLRQREKDITLYEAVGCINCQGTGYQGRIGIFEMVRVDNKLRKLIARGCEEDKLGMEASFLTTLYDDAVAKVLNGTTTVEEIKRIIVAREEE